MQDGHFSHPGNHHSDERYYAFSLLMMQGVAVSAAPPPGWRLTRFGGFFIACRSLRDLMRK
ncbi:hypothetical protein ABNO07_003534 [Salmonella enterica subsp. enterica serovar Bareilly]